MCCFARPILSVFGTKIFARLSGTGTQYLAYEMSFESEEPNAMILPIPVKLPSVPEAVKFIDLSEYADFFNDLASAYPSVDLGLGCSKSSLGKLQVHKVGNFIASFVPSVDDFEKLDTQFSIPKETWLKIPAYTDYGFVVFQLAELNGKPHPMAFEFDTRSDTIFFPTVHIHDGEVHTEEDFDHNLFLQHAGFDTIVDSYAGSHLRDNATDFVRSKDVASSSCDIARTKGIVAPDLLIHRHDLYGQLENKDMVFAPKGDPMKPGLNLKKYKFALPWAVAIGCAGWFFNRRSKIKKSTQTKSHEVSNS